MGGYKEIADKVDLFINKYYKNTLLKGAFVFCGVLISSVLVLATIEYFGRFGSFVRGGLFLSFLILNIIFLYNLILTPLLKIYGFKKGLSQLEAAQLIGDLFDEVSDKLVNTLQLKNQSTSEGDVDLLMSSIDQRSAQLNKFNFSEGISYQENKKQLKWFIPVVSVLLLMGSLNPNLLFSSTHRIFNFTKEFIEPSPYDYSLINTDKVYYSGDDIPIEVLITGEVIPAKVYFESADGIRLMEKISKNRFKIELENVQQNIRFSFKSSYDGKDYQSTFFNKSIIGRTAIRRLQVAASYPKYLGLKNEIFNNVSGLSLPEGTILKYSILSENARSVHVLSNQKDSVFNSGSIQFNSILTNSHVQQLILENKFTGSKDTTVLVIESVKDQYPSIKVMENIDSLQGSVRYFKGTIHDDYGLKKLDFHYEVSNDKGVKFANKINVRPVTGLDYNFTFAVDFLREKVEVGDKVTYFFSVNDNDGVNGSKQTRSNLFIYELPTQDELNKEHQKTTEETKDEFDQIQKQTKEFKERLNELRKDLLNEKSDSWNNTTDLERLQKDYNELLNKSESLKEKLNSSQEKKNQLSEADERLLEKQDELNKLLDQLLDKEMLDMIKELQDLMKQEDKESIKELMDKMEMNSDDLEKNMDRSLESLKKLQVDEKIDDIKNKLDELSKKQDALLGDDSLENQEKINKEFSELKDELDELNDLNDNLKSPMELEALEENKEQIDDDLKEAKESLEKGKKKKSDDSKQSASDEMQEMSDQLEAMQEQAQDEQQEEDMQALREILEQLISLSIEQEFLRDEMSSVNQNDPKILTVGKKQRKVFDDTKVLSDSLNALAMRQPMIAMFIDKELGDLFSNHNLILEDFDERRMNQLLNHQQLTMTSYNNLALMLDESLKKMQQQAQKSGAGSCSKPGGKGKPSSGESTESMKEQLKKQLEKMKKGNKPGGQKPGDKEGKGKGKKPGEGGMLGMGAKQSAKMAAEQRMMRQALEKIREEMNKDGSGSGNKLNPLLDELKKQENDLINQKTDDLIERQQEILTRLLESEKAIKERDLDEKRESKSGKNSNNGNQIEFEEYKNKKLEQIELIQFIDPRFYKYYKDKASEYLNKSY